MLSIKCVLYNRLSFLFLPWRCFGRTYGCLRVLVILNLPQNPPAKTMTEMSKGESGGRLRLASRLRIIFGENNFDPTPNKAGQPCTSQQNISTLQVCKDLPRACIYGTRSIYTMTGNKMHSLVRPNAWVVLRLPSDSFKVLQVTPNS
jgi:hypothetical protein